MLVQVLRVAPGDVGLRVLGAASLARLGLRTLAESMLESVPDSAGEAVASLRAVLARLPDERVGPEQLDAMVRENLAAVRDGSAADRLRASLPRWRVEARDWTWHRANDGNVVRRRGEEWRGLGDHVAAAARFVREHFDASADLSAVTLEGVDPPWLLREIARALPRRKDGFTPRIVVVQADELEFLDGLAQADLADVLSRDGLESFVGSDATERLGDWLGERHDRRIAGPLVPLMSLRRRATPATETMLRSAEAAQQAEHARLVERVTRAYAGRSPGEWRERLAGPLRVLIPTCRYSTFIRHASEDLAGAFRAAGHEARVLIEPDSSSRMSSVAYLRALDGFVPDVIVLINYMRWHLGAWFPREVPFVTWIQDTMPQQFDAAPGGVGGQDYVIGHVHPELIARVGFPRERTLEMPVVASDGKFHPGPVPPEVRSRHECEVAFVSHHSETPEAMHARLCDEARRSGSGEVVARILERAREGVVAAARETMDPRLFQRLERVVRDAAEGVISGSAGDDGVVTPIVRQYAIPLAERVARHDVIGWAAEMSARRGWRCRVYGRGWETHPRFGALAAGELEHGEALRAAYQCAAVQLHVSLSSMVHQRVMECAMSGGLPLCLLTGPSLAMVESALRREAWSPEVISACNVATRREGARTADAASLMALATQRQRLGLAADEFAWFGAGRGDRTRPRQMPGEQRPDLLLGDLAQASFWNAEGLERLVERAIERPSWREAVARVIAGRSRDRLTHAALVPRIIDLVRRGQEARDGAA